MRYATTLLILFRGALAEAAPNGVLIAQLSDWNIVVAEDAIPSKHYAAREFQHFFERATGIKAEDHKSASQRDYSADDARFQHHGSD